MTVSASHRPRVQAVCLLCLCLLPSAKAIAQAPSYRRWVLAEGAVSDFFRTDIAIANPNVHPASVHVTLLPEAYPGEVNPPAPVTLGIAVPPTSRYTLRLNDLPEAATSLRNRSVGAIVTCQELDILVERTMTWGSASHAPYGGHNSQGVLAPASRWFLAEGATGFFSTFVLIANTSATQSAEVSVRFLREDRDPLVTAYTIPPSGRRTIFVNRDFPELDYASFSTDVIQTDGGATIVVERAMYWNGNKAGHGSAGVNAPSQTWLFAEGATGGTPAFNFQSYLLLANPDATSSPVIITFFRDNAGPLFYETVVGPRRRLTLPVHALEFPGLGRALASGSFSMRVDSTFPILAERAMYWSSGGVSLVEGHDTLGATAEASKWAFAEGIEGRVLSDVYAHDSYFLFANASDTELRLKATFLLEDGRGLVPPAIVVPPRSRYTLLTSHFPELSNRRFSAFFEAVDANGAPIDHRFVAERAVYWGDGYLGGHATMGTPWAGAIGTPPPADVTPVIGSVVPSNGPLAGGTRVIITGANFAEGAQVEFGDTPAASMVTNATEIVAVSPPRAAAGAAPVRVFNPPRTGESQRVPSANAGSFTYDAPPPTNPVLTTDNVLSFGDSITQGVICTPPGLPPVCFVTQQPYPTRLRALLARRYPAQAVAVENAGSGGECASTSACNGQSGRGRLPTRLRPEQDLVVLLEGVNDVNTGVSIGAIYDALRAMVLTARGQGKHVIICTLTPATSDRVDPARRAALNNAINQLAVELVLPRVDMSAAFGSNWQQYLSDGLHPNDAGYQRMAEAIRDKIVEFFELRP
jgi:lysophospholipase L1-like esterase